MPENREYKVTVLSGGVVPVSQAFKANSKDNRGYRVPEKITGHSGFRYRYDAAWAPIGQLCRKPK